MSGVALFDWQCSNHWNRFPNPLACGSDFQVSSLNHWNLCGPPDTKVCLKILSSWLAQSFEENQPFIQWQRQIILEKKVIFNIKRAIYVCVCFVKKSWSGRNWFWQMFQSLQLVPISDWVIWVNLFSFWRKSTFFSFEENLSSFFTRGCCLVGVAMFQSMKSFQSQKSDQSVFKEFSFEKIYLFSFEEKQTLSRLTNKEEKLSLETKDSTEGNFPLVYPPQVSSTFCNFYICICICIYHNYLYLYIFPLV